jgi:DDE superfamily endonuclease
VAGKGDRDVAVPAAEADLGLAEAGPSGGDTCGDPGGDVVPGLLVGRLRHAVHDGRQHPPRPLAPFQGNGLLPMLPDMVPASLMTLLQAFAPLFTAPSFRTFTALACGFLAQPGKRTVCGMLTGAGLSQLWPHDRAHGFFSRARWNADGLGLAAAVLVVSLLVPAGAPVDVAVDDTLFK